jgi:hypothetical protein
MILVRKIAPFNNIEERYLSREELAQLLRGLADEVMDAEECELLISLTDHVLMENLSVSARITEEVVAL